ncbi:MAG: AhpC/TSA family protein [Bacteroidaceae bacterium]|nr:AhpC/TSA family protein [Bacteroidaceae bacterium]
MRILSIFVLSALALTSVAQNYTITGKAGEKAEGMQVVITNQDTQAVSYEEPRVTDGAFKVEGTVEDQTLLEIYVGNKRNRAYVIVEPGANVTVDFTQKPVVVTGGLNDKLAAVEKEVNEKGNALNEKIRQYQTEGKSREEITAIVEPEIESIYAVYRKAIDDNKDNMVGAYFLGVTASQFFPSLESLEAVMAEVKYAEKIAALRLERDGYLKAAATQAGKMFVDFTGLTVDGQPSKLSDYVGKGKYVLVDFWASWCGPCKGEIPNLIELQEKFGGDKFTVLGVNVWDEEDKFKAALTAEGITYPQIYVPRDNKDNATDLYGIKGIPQIILFAPDGTIVQRDLRGNAMKALVEEKMK